MATFLFNQIVFGPVKSRRLGVSLGINLLPVDSKICSFNCIYCECGRNPFPGTGKRKLPTAEEVKSALEIRLSKMQKESLLPDVITFAGNGEPTLHSQFAEIVDDTLALRDRYAPRARVAVLSNATMLHRNSVFKALLKVDENILKLDSGMEATIRKLNCPVERFSMSDLVQNLKSFNGKLIIQTMFIRGSYKGKTIDNTTPTELTAWLKLIREIKPSQVMIYTIARDTPEEGLEKISMEELRTIAALVSESGIQVQVSG
jgi:wyosine [tRNA(Phe)-imidazoG37] synthetase (radical SAM superfamily)